MRQGGMVPKGHNSGVYWVRANANSKSSSEQEIKEMELPDKWTWIGYLLGLIIVITLLIMGIGHNGN